MRSVVTALVLAAALAAPAAAQAATLHVKPQLVAQGATTRVFGNSGGGCATSDRVTLLSRAFPHTHEFAGVPAVFASQRASGSFSKRVRIPAHRKPGRYTVTARCGGGTFGIVRHLRVLDPGLTARAVAIGAHAAFVRATIRFTGGTLGTTDAEAADPDPFDGTTRLTITDAKVGTTAPAARRLGVRVTIAQGVGRLHVRAASAGRRFKYVAYRRLHGPERLAIDLYRSRPPTAGAQIPGSAGSCLSISRHADTGGTITASGKAHGIFENQFTLAVRSMSGRLAGHRNVAFGTTAPNWSSSVSYTVTSNQPGTLEAVELSPRDGSLACLAQIRVPLAAPLSPPSASAR